MMMMLLMMSIDRDHNNDLEFWTPANNPALFLLNKINLRYSFSLSSYSSLHSPDLLCSK